MCHQFALPSLAEIKKYLNKDLNLPLAETSLAWPANKMIFPKQVAPILLYQDEQLQLVPKIWGYQNPLAPNQVVFNARVERFFATKASMWDQSFARFRCLILTNCFYEIAPQTYMGQNQQCYHEQFSIRNAAEPITLLAGIYQQDRFAMVTTNPNDMIMPIHNRMPLVIEPHELRQWLFQNFASLIDRQHVNLTTEQLPHH